jgi:hypothetical protein
MQSTSYRRAALHRLSFRATGNIEVTFLSSSIHAQYMYVKNERAESGLCIFPHDYPFTEQVF